MPHVGSRAGLAAMLGLALALPAANSRAQGRVPDAYVLVAEHALNADNLTVHAGDVVVLAGTLSAPRGLSARTSALAAPAARLDEAAACDTLFTANLRGGGPTCGPPQAFTRPFTTVADACGFPAPFPACDPLRPAIIIPHGASVALPPGVYGDVRVEGGAGGPGTLLLAGSYAICNLRAGREARIRFTGSSQVMIAGTLTASTAAELAPDPGSGVSPPDVRVFVAGALVRASRKAHLALDLCAPRAALRVGTRGTLAGRFMASDIRLRRADVSLARDPGSTSTTTTTTLPSAPQCGNRVLEAGEVCDGDVACTSPGAAFLNCSACAAFTSGPCTSTTTTTLPPSAGPRCGDGVPDPGEQCDDGNLADCDGCSAGCTAEVTGNGLLECDEECDDGNDTDCDGCNAAGEIECGNGAIESACGEVCDGDDVADQTCAGGTVTCAPDCRRADRTACPPGDTAPHEVCGNCVDDDLNGMTDFEDPACCGGPPAIAGTLRALRLKPRRTGRTSVRVRARLDSRMLALSPTNDDVFRQVRGGNGAELLCARIPAGSLRAGRKGLRFRDPAHTVASAQALDLVRLRRTARGDARATVIGRRTAVTMPPPGPARVTVGITDTARGPSSNRCAAMTTTLRAARRGGLRAP